MARKGTVRLRSSLRIRSVSWLFGVFLGLFGVLNGLDLGRYLLCLSTSSVWVWNEMVMVVLLVLLPSLSDSS